MLTLGFVGITILCLCPPYQWERTTYLINGRTPHKVDVVIENAGHCWIWDAPKGWTGEALRTYERVRVANNAKVDWPRLGLYVGLIAASALFAAFVVFRKREWRAWGCDWRGVGEIADCRTS